jgi:hypothetical protein
MKLRYYKDVVNPVGPRPSFGETLVSFGPLLDFDTLVEVGAPTELRSWNSPILRVVWTQ